MSLQEAIIHRCTSEVVHFSINKWIIGSLYSNYLLSRPLIKEDDYLRHILQLNTQVRHEESAYLDKSEEWISFVNVSISEINKRFFSEMAQ